MANLKPVGSEKLTLDSKLKRIMEIANYGVVQPTKEHNTATLEYSIQGADGCNYGIIRENSNYNILKEGKKGYTHLDGMLNNKKYTFSSFSGALKKLNLLMKPLNESYNKGHQLNLIGEQEEDTKFVLKTPEAEEEEDFSLDVEEGGTEEEFGGEEELDLDLEGEEDFDLEGDLEAEEAEGDAEEENFTKAIQKLTGKLGQKLRDVPETEVDGDLIKYVLNSIISAVDLTKLSEEDTDDIIAKIEDDEELDYTEEGEYDVELGGEEELDLDLDLEGEEEGGEEIDLETELEESVVDMDNEEDINEFWPAVRAAAGAAAGDWAVKKATKSLGLDEVDVPLNADEVDGIGVDPEILDDIADVFNEGKTQQTISKYFKYTTKEKAKKNKLIAEKLSKIRSQKTELLTNAIGRAKTKRAIHESLCSYEQETTVNQFLKENKEFEFIGNNERESIFFRNKGKLVEITKYGTKI
tara:strand:- start:304 stop:1707 length:1404 start_codon:yes stop_codon:yes gene_type:complete